MVVGQDWGDIDYFRKHKGQDQPNNPTNHALVELVGVAGIEIDKVGSTAGRHHAFFTNAVLCLKKAKGGLQGKVQKSWFRNCAQFVRRQIEVVRPRVVVGLGEHAYRTILEHIVCRAVSFARRLKQPAGGFYRTGHAPSRFTTVAAGSRTRIGRWISKNKTGRAYGVSWGRIKGSGDELRGGSLQILALHQHMRKFGKLLLAASALYVGLLVLIFFSHIIDRIIVFPNHRAIDAKGESGC